MFAFAIAYDILNELGTSFAIDPSAEKDWYIFRHKEGLAFTMRVSPYNYEGRYVFSVHCPRDHSGASMRFEDWGEEPLPTITIAETKPPKQLVKELRSRLLDDALPVIKRIAEKRETDKKAEALKREAYLKVLAYADNIAHPSQSSYSASGFLDNDRYLQIELAGSYKLSIDYLSQAEAIAVIELLKTFPERMP